MDFKRLFDIPAYQQSRYPQQTAAAGRRNGQWQHWSIEKLREDSAALAGALYGAGFRKSDCIGILTHCGSPEWLAADLAMQQIGAVPVPIHTTARPDEIRHIAADAGLKACFVSNAEMLLLLQNAGAAIPQFFSFEPVEGAVSLADLLDNAPKLPAGTSDAVSETDIATILYTSGTTGVPKGVVLTHANIVSNVKAVLAITPLNSNITTVSFLPMSHIFERMVVYVYLAAGASVWFVETLDKLPETLREVRPHFFTAVPRVMERSYERLLERRQQSGKLGRKILDWAIALGERYPYAGGGFIPPVYRLKRLVADFLVYRRWRKALGGRLHGIVVGAAALQPRLGRLFCAAGIEVREGYGLTETSPVIAFNRFEPGGVHFGTVGIAVPGVEVRIADADAQGDGEIEVRGPNVMQGYLNKPEESAERFTPDGWLRTGDIGRIEHKRFLKITGRKSEIFKTSTGKFVAPAFVEQQLLHSPYIGQCMSVGLNRPYVAALIVPNFEQLEAWCRENKVHWTAPEYMILNQKIQKLLQEEIDRINETLLGQVEKVHKFRLLHGAWTAENGLLTPTLKLRRERIGDLFEKEIVAMF